MGRALVVPVGPGRSGAAEVAEVTRAVASALSGRGPAVAAVARAAPDEASRPDGPEVPDDVALVVRTSGSTGRPRHVLLTRDALEASARATHERLGGPGRWLLALPLDHVAGLQVVARTVLAGGRPAVVPEPADPAALADAVTRARTQDPGAWLYASLVPTQLRRVVQAPEHARALRALDAVLVGGASAAPALLDRARELGLRVVTTYGMSETCGGCVYDGVPLDGVDVELDDAGRVLLAGPVLARGYLDDPAAQAEAFVERGGRRWHRTNDAGRLDGGRLHVVGRADDVLVTGGEKVAPAAVEAALAALGLEACVVGVPDPEWGQAVVAVVVRPAHGQPAGLDDVRTAVRRTLGQAAAPRHLVLVDALPLRGPGKVDRSAVARLARGAVRA
ncbi:o-succinylbenzoate--CoA ligase [Actinotalea sp. JY-7885]|uniref:o-succinylbenzoate--CoA ligase n=1 Tax=Actinotalea sp. JY-7885 TaxID=2758576 RepID=UPI00165E4477|nr:o-succinylbenzoate--CoA ligase [Actinotalea sp. JY-7885]